MEHDMTKTMSHPKRGEGFAFFRWHCLTFPDSPHCVGRGVCKFRWGAKEGRR
jgi:hypothetical protein